METFELATSKNDKGFDHARALIRKGKVIESDEWSGPKAGTANSYIEKNGWKEYGKWFMGKNPDFEEESKGHWKYPFTSDFDSVSINGLKAIRSRAGQTEETEIFNAAGKLLDMAIGDDEKKGEEEEEMGPRWLPRQPWLPAAPRLPRARRLPPDRGGPRGRIDPTGRWVPGRPNRRYEDETEETILSGIGTFSTFCMEAQNPSKVDPENGIIEGISIITTGEAKGHQMMISQKTLESSITLLLGKSLPAYLSHSGAKGDRLLTEVGFFSGFYRVKDKIRASRFVAMETFKEYEPEKYKRLFELAEVAPESFGVSIVFEGQLFWEMSDGTEVGMEIGLDAPENSRFQVPTVRPLAITSADFVDTPAANKALFSGKVDNPTISKEDHMNISETEIALDIHAPNESASSKHVSDEEEKAAPVVAIEEPPPTAKKKKAKKKALAEQDEEDRKDEERGEEDEIAKEDQGEEAAKEDDDAEKRDDDEEPDADELEEPEDEYQEKMRAAVEEVYSHMEAGLQRLREVMDMTGVPDTRKEEAQEEEEEEEKKPDEEEEELAKLKARVEELMKLNQGTRPLKESTKKTFSDVKQAKKHLIEKHLELHPGDSRPTALLAVAKHNPELFQQN